MKPFLYALALERRLLTPASLLEDTPLELIRAIRPDVLVKGGDYTVETVVGHEDVIAAGGRVEIVATVEGFSTSNIVKKLQQG